MERLYVLYDPRCGFCVRCAMWLREQRTFVPLTCIPSGTEQALRRFPGLRTTQKEELTVVDARGGVYRGAKAWLMTLWALEDYRAWSLRLARPGLLPLARNAFELVSSNRHRIARTLNMKTEGELADALRATVGPGDKPRCEGNDCAPTTCRACAGLIPKTAMRCAWCGLWKPVAA